MANTHYSLGLNAEELIDAVDHQANLIQARKKLNKRVPILIFSGFSGVSHATALSLELHRRHIPYRMAYIRKDNEDSHGSMVEHDMGPKRGTWDIPQKFYLLFVDDLIESGNTLKYCVKSFKQWFNIEKRVSVYLCLAADSDDALINYHKRM